MFSVMEQEWLSYAAADGCGEGEESPKQQKTRWKTRMMDHRRPGLD